MKGLQETGMDVLTKVFGLIPLSLGIKGAFPKLM